MCTHHQSIHPLLGLFTHSTVRITRWPFTLDYLRAVGTYGNPICEEPRGVLTAGSWVVIGMYCFLGSSLIIGSLLDYLLPDKGVDGEYRRRGSYCETS